MHSSHKNYLKENREICFTTDQLAQSRVHWTSVQEVAGLNPGRTKTQGPEEKVLPLLLHLQMVRLLVFSDKDNKPEVPSHSPCSLTLWDGSGTLKISHTIRKE